jgi:hypothetical protein
MNKQQHDTNLNDPSTNNHPFSENNTEKGIDQSNPDGSEGDGDGLLPDNARIQRNLSHDLNEIRNHAKNVSAAILLLILGLYCIHTWNNTTTDSVIVWQDSEYTTTAEQEYTLSSNSSAPPDHPSKIRTQLARDPIYRSESILHLKEQMNYNDIANSYKIDPVMILDKITLPEKLTSSINNPLFIHRDMKPGNFLANDQNNSGPLFKYEFYKIDNLEDKLISSNTSINIALNNSNNLNTTGSRNCNIGSYQTQISNQFKKLKSDLDTSELILARNKDLLEKRILLLNTYVQEYTKTTIHLEKDKILFLSCHGTISSPDCNLTFGPEGLNIIPESSDCGRLIKNYPLGALLFRMNDQDDWKMYSNSQMRIIAEKDGILEFTINYKVQKKNTLSGKFAVSVFTNQ